MAQTRAILWRIGSSLPLFSLLLIAISVLSTCAHALRRCDKDVNFCSCKDDGCSECIAAPFGGCCYRFRATNTTVKYNCSSAHPPPGTYSVKRQCNGGCVDGIDKKCAKCGTLEGIQRCETCSRGFEMVFSGDVRACCELFEADQMDKIVANVTLAFIGVGALATASVLLWYFYVRRRPVHVEELDDL